MFFLVFGLVSGWAEYLFLQSECVITNISIKAHTVLLTLIKETKRKKKTWPNMNITSADISDHLFKKMFSIIKWQTLIKSQFSWTIHLNHNTVLSLQSMAMWLLHTSLLISAQWHEVMGLLIILIKKSLTKVLMFVFLKHSRITFKLDKVKSVLQAITSQKHRWTGKHTQIKLNKLIQ